MYEAKDYRALKIDNISDGLIAYHLELYQAYVKNANHIVEHLETEEDATLFSELKRRFGWEWNGMRLHEYFFENIGATEELSHGALMEKIEKDFGSFAAWREDFKRLCAIRGIGWAAVFYDQQADRLINVWIGEHDTGHLAGCNLILILDFFEHAFTVDKLKRSDYIEIIIKAIKWSEVEKRFE